MKNIKERERELQSSIKVRNKVQLKNHTNKLTHSQLVTLLI